MTITSNILFPGLSGAPGAAQSPASTGGSGTLLDLITQMIGDTTGQPAGTDVSALSAKLAALLQNQPGGEQKTDKDGQLQALIQLLKEKQADATPTAVPGQTQQNLAPQLLQMIQQQDTSDATPSVSTLSRDTELKTLLNLLKPQGETPLLTPATHGDSHLKDVLKQLGDQAQDGETTPAAGQDGQIQNLLQLLQTQNIPAPAPKTGDTADAEVMVKKTQALPQPLGLAATGEKSVAAAELAAKIQALLKPQEDPAAPAASHDLQALLKLLQPQPAAEDAPALSVMDKDRLKDLLARLQQSVQLQQPAPAAGQIAVPQPPKAELLNKIVALLQASKPQTIQPALNSDLSSGTAPLVQSMPAELQKKLGALLASAGSDKKTDEKIERLLNLLAPQQASAPPVADTGLVVQLREKMSDPAAHFTRDDAVQFLKDKGLDMPAVQKIMATLDKPAMAQPDAPVIQIATDTDKPLPVVRHAHLQASLQQPLEQPQDGATPAPSSAASRKNQILALLQLLQPQDDGTPATTATSTTAPAAPHDGKLKALIRLLQPQHDTVPLPLLQPQGNAAPAATGNDRLQALLTLLGPQQPADAPDTQAPSIQTPAPQNAAIQTTLSGDLPADSVVLVQSLPAGLQKKLGGLLASAGSDRKTDIRIAQVLHILLPRPAETPLPEKTDLLAQLQAKMNDFAAPFTRDDAVQFLKDKGLDTPAIQKIMAELDKPAPQTNDAAPETASKPALPQLAAKTEAPQFAEKTEAPKFVAKVETPPPATDARQPVAPQTQKQAPETAQQQTPNQPQPTAQPAAPQPKLAQTAQHISYINSLAHDSGFEPGTGGGEQQQTAAQLFGQATPETQAFAGIGGIGQGFANYMSAANGGAQSPVTQTVAIQMQANALSKVDVMTLQLTANLGRLSIRMKFDRDGGIRAHLTADRPETLALLRSDSTHLQRALQQAGFDTDDSTLSFDLRQHGEQHAGAGGTQDDGRNGGKAGHNVNNTPDTAQLQAQIAAQAYGYVSQGGVNIMV